MGYGWKAKADQVGERIPDGIHVLTVDRVMTSTKAGVMTSSSGDPQIRVMFTDANDCEASQLFTLSDKAAWALSKMLSRAGVDLEAMEREGIEPRHFANKVFAEQRLVGLKLWARVTTSLPDAKGRTYPNVEPLTAAEAGQAKPVAVAAGAEDGFEEATGEPVEDDIPFDSRTRRGK